MAQKTTYEQVQQQKAVVRVLEKAYIEITESIEWLKYKEQDVPQSMYDALENTGQELTKQKAVATTLETEHMLDTVGTLD